METTRNGTLAIYFGFNGILQAASLRVLFMIGNLHFDALPTAFKPVLNSRSTYKCTANGKVY